MNFRKYQHIERLGTNHVSGILDGLCYVFYKIDGTNSSLWMGDDGIMSGGSRKRELSVDNDNAGFYTTALKDPKLELFFKKYPHLRLYGEWLVPHSLKTYSDDAWRKFYVFDVTMDTGKLNDEGVMGLEYLPYETYKEMLDEFGILYIPPLALIKNPTMEDLNKLLEKTGQFLVKDGAGIGEGIVIKNYDYYNDRGKQNWAKIVANEFKTIHHKAMGAPLIHGSLLIEEHIIDEFMTEAFIDKELSKIKVKYGGWKSKYIGEFIGRTMDEFLREEAYNFIKHFKNPKINFKMLYALGINKIKKTKVEVFR